MNTSTLDQPPPTPPPSSEADAFAATKPPANAPEPEMMVGVPARSPAPGGGVDLPKRAAPATQPSRGRMTKANVRRGVLAEPLRILIYGSEKIGKSTFAAGAPDPIWLGADAGTGHLDIARMPEPTSFDEIREGVHFVTANAKKEGWRTLVIDPANWHEQLLIADILKDSGDTLQSYGGGYGRGEAALIERWRLLRADLDAAWKAGLNVIICAHSATKTFNDPEGPSFDRYELAMSKNSAGLLKQWVDAVLFAKADSYGKLDATKKAKAHGTGERLLHTEWSPAFDAGNRMKLPAELPLSWAAFAEAMATVAERTRARRKEIDAALAELNDPSITDKVRMWLSDPKNDVDEIAGVVMKKLAERKA